MTPDANALDVGRARESFQRFVDLAFGNAGPRPRLSIPADPDRDDDLIVSAALDRLAALEAENARLRAVAVAVPAVIAEADRETVSFQTLRRALAALAPSDSSAKEKS